LHWVFKNVVIQINTFTEHWVFSICFKTQAFKKHFEWGG